MVHGRHQRVDLAAREQGAPGPPAAVPLARLEHHEQRVEARRQLVHGPRREVVFGGEILLDVEVVELAGIELVREGSAGGGLRRKGRAGPG